MAVYRKISRVTDLQELSKNLSESQILLAANKKNYKISAELLNQKRIVDAVQAFNDKDGEVSTINLQMKDGSFVRLAVYNGPTGDKGKPGAQGERGDKGDTALLDENRSEKYLLIVNDNETDDATKVWSAAQGIIMNDDINKLSETFMSDEKYQLLFRDLVFMDAEFETDEDNQNILLFNSDPVEHKIYVKYWTYESDGSTEYFVYNDFGKTYDSVLVDLWEDIYLGNTEGYFLATNAQLTDGNELFVLNDSEYQSITVDESGNRTFKYYLDTIDAWVNVSYDKIKKQYDYNLEAEELPLNVYIQEGTDSYSKVNSKDEINTEGFTIYYTLVDGNYEMIENIEAFLAKASERFYVKSDEGWTEKKSLEDINTNSFEEYIKVDYKASTNVNTFTRFYHVKTIREEYYESKSQTLNNYSIEYYVYDDNREYFTRKLVEKEGVWDYEYTKIDIPFWVDAEFVTDEEDQTILLLNSDKEASEIEEKEKVYLSSIEFEESEVVIAKNSVNNIDLTYHPTNVTVTDVVMEYDENVITLYEDGRIAAVTTDEITLETLIKVFAKDKPAVSDTIKVIIVTPVDEIVPNTEQINLYPGESFKLEYTTVPEQVSNGKVTWNASVPNMLTISENGEISLRKQADGSYITGNCTLIGTADDGFGTICEIPVLAAIPVESVEITSKDFGFIDVAENIQCTVLPENATQKTLKYYSSDPEVITINETSGRYTPLKHGKATISVVSTDGTNITDSIEITITRGVSSITIEGIDSVLDVGLTNEFVITVLPEDADNLGITFNVSDKSIVEFEEPKLIVGSKNKYSGWIKTIKGGTTNIAAIAADGSNIYKDIDVNVTIPISDITFENPEVQMFTGAVLTIPTIIGPADASSKEIVWHSSNVKVAIVDEFGRVQGVGAGKTIISATSKDSNNVMASCILTVNTPVETIVFESGVETMNIKVDTIEYISVSVTPDFASNQIINWVSSDPEIVVVNENGVIYGNKLGNAIITAFSTDGTNVSASISVNVVEEFPSEEQINS